MSRNYDDILCLPHPTSVRHPRMTMIDRAAQFSPFAALTGYDAAIRETGRRTGSRIELDEDARCALDLKQQLLMELLPVQPEVSVTHFVPDHRKAGGSYTTVHGILKKVDVHERILLLADGTLIPLDDIIDLDSGAFAGLL